MRKNYINRKTKLRLIACAILFTFSFNVSKVTAQGCTPPGASIAAPVKLTCNNRTIILSGSSPTTGASFSWTGPGSFTSFSATPSVSIAGTYNLTVTSPVGGCTSTASVVVQQDTIQPDAHTSVSNIMTCASPTINVNGISSTPGATFSWIGPNNFTSAQQNLSVTVAGGYTLMVTSPVNGCISTATAYVDKNTELPTASAYVSGDLTCTTASVSLTSSSATSGVSYSWIGPGFSTPVLAQNTATSVGGTYTVTTTNPLNGCQSTASVSVVQNLSQPGASVTTSTNTITCANINADLSGHSTSTGVTYYWTGPGLNENVQNVTVTAAGLYVLKVIKAQNGCISKDSVTIALDKTRPDATGTVSGPITCTTSVVALHGASNTSGVTYKWQGPSGFGTSSLQNPNTTLPGGYILFVTNTANGCITTKPVTVSQNVTLPVSVTANNNGPLTCATTSISLSGSSSTPGVSFTWMGPNSTTYTGTNPSVSQAGNYILTVSNPANGCSASASTTVTEDKSKPSATASNGGPLTCTINTITLTGSSTSSGVIYQWKNQAGTIIANTQNTDVSLSGIYSLIVTNPTNGCSNTTVTAVSANINKPTLVVASNDGPLTCTLLSTKVNASSSTTGVSYNWSGPGGFSSNTKNPSVSQFGTYKVTVTNTQNGCFDTTSTYLAQNVNLPGASIATAPNLTCTNTSITISASSPTTGVTYNWSGPSNFASTEQNPHTNKLGTYTVTVTNPVNGCVSTASTTVNQDITTPQNVVASAPDSLTCTRLNVTIAVTSSTSNLSYAWTGPGGFTSSAQNPSVTLKGNYTVAVTSQANGCVTFATTTVSKDTLKPAHVSAAASDILNCANASVTLIGSSTTPGVTYNWVGPGLSSTSATPSVSAIGTYNLTVTSTHNGCSATASAIVTENHTSPGAITISASDKLTCGRLHVTVTASSALGGSEYHWEGPSSYESNEQTPSVSLSGPYFVTATNPGSKCTTTASISVLQDTVAPANVSAAASDIITCNNTSVNITGNSTTNGVTYSWSGPNNFTSSLQVPVVSSGGQYRLTVTNPANGCTKVREITVNMDTIRPADVTVEISNNLNCTNSSAMLTGNSSTPGVEYLWNYAGSMYATDQITFAVLEGDYTLDVTNSANGCITERIATVIGDYVPPVCNLDVPNNSTVLQQTTNTINAGFNASYSYSWSITNWSPISGQNTQALTYMSGVTGTSSLITVNIFDNNNGCSSACAVNLTAVTTKFKNAFTNDNTPVNTEGLGLFAYPTPSAGKVSVEFMSPEQTYATVDVYDTNGLKIASLFSKNIEAGQNNKVVFNETETLPAGVYICVFKTRAKTTFSKIIIK